jgi:hypothetical protein
MTARPQPAEPTHRVPWLGAAAAFAAAAAAGGAGCASLHDRMGLAEQRAGATVLAKEHRLPRRTYATVLINGRPHVVPRAIGEQWLVGLRFASPADGTAVAAVERELFAGLQEGQEVAVVFRRGLLSGTVEVLAVEP